MSYSIPSDIPSRQCPNCGRNVLSSHNFCPWCSAALSSSTNFLIEESIQAKIEKQIKDQMKSEQLIVSEISEKVIKSLKYNFLPILALIGVMGWMGWSELKSIVKPIVNEAEAEAREALSTARQATDKINKSNKEIDRAHASIRESITQTNALNKNVSLKIDHTKDALKTIEEAVAISTKEIEKKLTLLAQATSTFDKHLAVKTAEVKKYEQRITLIDKQIKALSLQEKIPGIDSLSSATVGTETIRAEEKKPGEKYLVFEMTQMAVNAGLMKLEDISSLQSNLEIKGFKIFIGHPAYGKVSNRFLVGPFLNNHWNNGTYVQYFGKHNYQAALDVYLELSKYLKISTQQPQIIEPLTFPKEKESVSQFIKTSGIDVFVRISPSR